MHRTLYGISYGFPILDKCVGNERLTYLGNAATTQTSTQVYDVYREFYEGYNANVHGGIHTRSHEASAVYEEPHDRIAEYTCVSGREEIIFTKNTT